MTTAGKTRLLLVMLFASLLITAIFVEQTYSPVNNLNQAAQILESNLHAKERDVYNLLTDNDSFTQLQLLQTNPANAGKYIDAFTVDKNIWFITLKDNKLNFWSGVKIIPQNPERIKDGSSFIKGDNGYYEVIKKTKGNFSAIFFILIKNNYQLQNKYLQNVFLTNISSDNNIDVADFTDKGTYSVHDIYDAYLFSVKLLPGKVNNRFFYFELFLWLLATLTLCLCIHTFARYLASKGYNWLALFILAGFIILLRFVNLHLGWPDITRELQIFNPIYYASSYVYPSLGDFCINILLITWLVVFAYTRRQALIKNVPGSITGYIIFFACMILLIAVAGSLLQLFNGLVVNSKISFDVNDVLNLSWYSVLGILMLCFGFLIFFLVGEIVITICLKLNIPISRQTILFAACIFIITFLASRYQTFSLVYFLWALIIVIRVYAHLYNDKNLTALSFIGIILLCAVIASISLNKFEREKEEGTRKLLIQRLELPTDATANILFKQIEKQIITDPVIAEYFSGDDHNTSYLKVRLQKLYFDRYLSKYDFDVHEFNNQGKPIFSDKTYSLDVFKDMVMYSSSKVSDYFYRENESFGFQSYFAILPVFDKNKNRGTIVIELKSKPLLSAGTFPELLIDREIKKEDEFKDYSYAFYIDNNLVGQNGTYVYKVSNNEFNAKVKRYTLFNNKKENRDWYSRFSMISHLLYKPSKRNLIVVTREENAAANAITALTFFFVTLLTFGAFAVLVRMLWLKLKIIRYNYNQTNLSLKLSLDRILYKTRIQFSMIFAVVITLVLVGFITFLSLSSQYQVQQDNLIRSKIMQISANFEKGTVNNYANNINEQSRVNFDEMAKLYSTDLTLFDLSGKLIITTQPKIYDFGLLARRMNARAYIALNNQMKSEFINEEKIGGLTYKAAYIPVRDVKHQTLAYLQLPYFANEADHRERVASLLNIMINVYALVFIAIGLFAVIIARQITAPLNFIQYSLSKTIYGKKNEPIKWDRNDEIGDLVKEYNNMISALENSARKLAQSERETAWREMAKQVAHEIKNPLTPLKLGLQLLDKSWKDKDPKFDQKFERFSKSFVEQIESLSSIASEFSAFAKMPDTRIETISLFEMLGQAVTIFKHMDNVKINLQMPETPFFISADRDQLLRCFNNLLKNAIEATPEGRECVIQVDYIITTKNVLLTIKDNGNGIPENLREKIFEPNFTTKSSGTGLGLAFVKNSIENANGKIWFETALGTGTTFYLNFPVKEE